MQPWVKKKSMLKGVRYNTTLEPLEREMLGDSAANVADRLMERARTAPKDELAELTGMPSGHAEAPQDPGLARILPSFFREGAEEIDGEATLMRQLNEVEIIKSKLINLQHIAEELGPSGSVNISLDEEEITPWLAALSDIRNYHHAQLEEIIAEYGEDSERVFPARNYLDWLGYCQNSLLEAVMGQLDIPEDDPGER